MTEESDFKKLVRERMAQTGENYTTARAAFRPDEPAAARPSDPQPEQSVTDGGLAAYRSVAPELTIDELVLLSTSE
ncbi:hypothetical protein [Occultella kanbiaonis]|uniref:hypothetical protein n=1 Tax=Occultella kanbiaonis TaxID=2675754 RepID=UPI001E4AF874|nr:hypothetical protein [Occultella kanbiaonis]